MMYFGMYLLTKLDSFKSLLCTISTACCIALVISTAATLIYSLVKSDSYYGDKDKTLFDHLKLAIQGFKLKFIVISTLVVMSINTLIPSTKQAAFIWIAPQIIENGAVKDTVKNIPELTKLGTDYLKELLKEKVENVK